MGKGGSFRKQTGSVRDGAWWTPRLGESMNPRQTISSPDPFCWKEKGRAFLFPLLARADARNPSEAWPRQLAVRFA
jgi:hypothetical protein